MMSERDEQVFRALADSTRRALLSTLAERSPKTATQLAQEFPITRQGILKHLSLLAEAGLVRVRPQGREKLYTFAPEPLDSVSDWLEVIGAKWDARLRRLKDLVENED